MDQSMIKKLDLNKTSSKNQQDDDRKDEIVSQDEPSQLYQCDEKCPPASQKKSKGASAKSIMPWRHHMTDRFGFSQFADMSRAPTEIARRMHHLPPCTMHLFPFAKIHSTRRFEIGNIWNVQNCQMVEFLEEYNYLSLPVNFLNFCWSAYFDIEMMILWNKWSDGTSMCI